MTTITQERLKSLLTYDPDTGNFARVKTGAHAGKVHKNGYVRVSVCDKLYLAHRLAWFYTHGKWPDSCIDHINRKRDDNRIANLRVVSKSENQHNRSINQNNKSGRTGVNWFAPKQRWRAYIKINGRIKHLGWFQNLPDAIAARASAEKTYHTSRPTDANN